MCPPVDHHRHVNKSPDRTTARCPPDYPAALTVATSHPHFEGEVWNQIAYKLTFEHCNVRESVSQLTFEHCDFPFSILQFALLLLPHFLWQSVEPVSPSTLCKAKCVRERLGKCVLPYTLCKAKCGTCNPLHTLQGKVCKANCRIENGKSQCSIETVKRIRVHCNVRRLACTQSDSTLPLRKCGREVATVKAAG